MSPKTITCGGRLNYCTDLTPIFFDNPSQFCVRHIEAFCHGVPVISAIDDTDLPGVKTGDFLPDPDLRLICRCSFKLFITL